MLAEQISLGKWAAVFGLTATVNEDTQRGLNLPSDVLNRLCPGCNVCGCPVGGGWSLLELQMGGGSEALLL